MFLSYYLGQRCQIFYKNPGMDPTPGKFGVILGIRFPVTIDQQYNFSGPVEVWFDDPDSKHIRWRNYSYDEIRPLLRPWSDLKPDEIKSLLWDDDSYLWKKTRKKGERTMIYTEEMPVTLRPKEYNFLCGIGIDLFDLIPAGLAIDKTKLPKP